MLVVGCCAVLAAAYFGLIRKPAKPLQDHDLFFPSSMNVSERQKFLDGNFRIIRDVAVLPAAVRERFTETGGIRMTLANPGQVFNGTDYIYDNTLPRRRLIMAGSAADRAFVVYEQGGIALTTQVEFFRLQGSSAIPLWRGYCAPAKNMEELRSSIARLRAGRGIKVSP